MPSWQCSRFFHDTAHALAEELFENEDLRQRARDVDVRMCFASDRECLVSQGVPAAQIFVPRDQS